MAARDHAAARYFVSVTALVVGFRQNATERRRRSRENKNGNKAVARFQSFCSRLAFEPAGLATRFPQAAKML